MIAQNLYLIAPLLIWLHIARQQMFFVLWNKLKLGTLNEGKILQVYLFVYIFHKLYCIIDRRFFKLKVINVYTVESLDGYQLTNQRNDFFGFNMMLDRFEVNSNSTLGGR